MNLSQYLSPRLKVESHQKPFSYFVLRDVFVTSFARKIQSTLKKQDFFRRDSDLFSFAQTEDLKKTQDVVLREFYSVLNSLELKQFIFQKMKIKAFGVIDCAGFLYQQGDYLLPHDDSLETRKIAYIYYLSPNFSSTDGGSLDLFSGNNVVTSLVPQFNSLILFPVLPGKSIHRVAEVVAKKKRYSFAGWFHA